jgi:hypothetical protein
MADTGTHDVGNYQCAMNKRPIHHLTVFVGPHAALAKLGNTRTRKPGVVTKMKSTFKQLIPATCHFIYTPSDAFHWLTSARDAVLEMPLVCPTMNLQQPTGSLSRQ